VTAGAADPAGPEIRAEGRYIVPSYVERTSYGVKEMNPYNKLFEDRIIFLGAPIDDTSANDVIAQLIALEGQDPDRVVSVYINSPGGSLTAMMAIYDTMEFIRPPIETTCIGQAANAAAILLAAGSPGKRAALANARVLLHQPSIEGGRGDSSDLEIHAREVIRLRTVMEKILARHTGHTEEEVRDFIERDKFLTATEAQDYGLIDEIITSRK
jgi:ATP-dependent Clp protease protease subunit